MRLLNYFKKLGTGRIIWVFIGNILIGIGVAIFKLSGLGNDPFNGMDMALADMLNVDYPTLQVVVNLILLCVEIAFGRKYIGLGTIVNAVMCGYVTKFVYYLLTSAFGTEFVFVLRVVIVVIGVVICSLGLSVYQNSKAGVSPFDSLSLIVKDNFPKIPYFWCRITFDAACALVCFLAGGIVGLGTIVSAFGLGPFVHMFDRFTVRLYSDNK